MVGVPRGDSPATKWRFLLTLGASVAVLLGAIAVSFMLGRFPISPGEAIQIMAGKVLGGPAPTDAGDQLAEQVVWQVRWPRILMAVIVGAALSCAGSAYQGVFRNPLVSPDVLGVSAACAFGAATGIVFLGGDSPVVQLAAFVSGLVGVGVSMFLAFHRGRVTNLMLILAGIVTGSLFNAGVSVMKYLADPLDELPAITFWLMGSLSGVRWNDLAYVAAVALVAIAVLVVVSWRLNVLTMGEAQARALGLNVTGLKLVVIACATALTATSVAKVGAIGWIGLVIPHIARFVVGEDHRKLIPVAAIIGAAFLLAIDDLTRSASEAALPLSIPIAFIGAPLFAVLLRRNARS